MAFQLSDGTGIPVDVPFSIGTTNYPANWLRLSTAEEKTAAGITEVADPTVYDSKGNVSKIGTFIAKHRNKPVISNIIDLANPDSYTRKQLRKSETFNTIKKFFPF